MAKDTTSSLLADLGLTAYEATAYLTLLRRDLFTPAELSIVAGIPRQRIHDVIESLNEKGLCCFPSARPRTVTAMEPDLALSALRQRRERALAEEQTWLNTKESELERELRLLREQGPKPQGPLRYLETYKNPVQIATVARRLVAGATGELKALLSGPAVLSPEDSVRLFAEPLGRGVTVRVLTDHSASPTHELGRLMKEFLLRGLEVRVLEGEPLPLRAEIVEGSGVLIYLKEPLTGPPSYSGTLVRHPAMISAMDLLFETLWQRPRARRLDAYGHPAS